MIFPAVLLVSDLYPHAPGLYCKCVCPHHAEGLGQTPLDGINGSQDSYQSHDPKSDDKNGQYGSEQIGPNRSQGNPNILYK